AEDTGTIMVVRFHEVTDGNRAGRETILEEPLFSHDEPLSDIELFFLTPTLNSMAGCPSRFHDGVLPALVDASREILLLDLRNPTVSDIHLRQLRSFTNLQTLMLAGSSVTDAGLKELAALENLA